MNDDLCNASEIVKAVGRAMKIISSQKGRKISPYEKALQGGVQAMRAQVG